MTNLNEKGSITVFVSLVLSMTILITTIGIEYAKKQVSQEILDQGIDLTINSVLARYNDYLKEYGIFAVDENLNDDVVYLIHENSSTYEFLNTVNFTLPKDRLIKLIDIEIEDIKFNPIEKSALANPFILRNQILEDMKYKGILTVSDSFIKKIKLFTDSNVLDSIEKKMIYEKEIYKVNMNVDDTYLSINKINEQLKTINFSKKVNEILLSEVNLSKAKIKDILLKTYLMESSFNMVDDGLVTDIKEKIKDLKEIDKYEYILKMLNPEIVIENDELKETSFISLIEKILDDNINIVERKVELISDKDSLIKVASYIKVYSEIKDESANYLKEKIILESIFKNINSIENKFSLKDENNILEDFIGEYKEKINTLDIIYKDFSDSIKSLESILVDEKTMEIRRKDWKDSIEEVKTAEVKTNLKGDYNSQTQDIDKIKIKNLIDSLSEKKETVKKLKDFLASFKYNNFYLMNINSENFKNKDLEIVKDLNELEKMLNDDVDKKFSYEEINDYKDINLIISDDDFYKYIKKMSSSNKKSVNEEKKNEGQTLIENSLKDFEKVSDKRDIKDYVSKEDLDYIDNFFIQNNKEKEDITFSKGSFLSMNESAINLISKTKKTLEDFNKGIENIRDQILILEYINLNFTSKGNLEKNIDFSSPFEGGEIEYILFGKDILASNFNLLASLIIAARLSFNLAYAFTSSELKVSTLSLATSIAGWSGFAVPLVQSVLLFILALNESILDFNNLDGGMNIPLVKNQNTWSSSVKGVIRGLKDDIKDQILEITDDVFYEIENFTFDKMDDIENSIYTYIDNTKRGAIDSMVDSVINPLIDEAKSAISSSNEISVIEIKQMLDLRINSIKNNLNINIDTDDLSKYIYELKSNEDGDEVFEALSLKIDSIKSDVFSEVNSKFDDLSTEAKGKIKGYLSEENENVKDKISDSLNHFTEKLENLGGEYDMSNDIDPKISMSSGIVFSYQEYLNIFLLFELSNKNSSDQLLSNILKVITMNLNGNFDVQNAYTAFSLEVEGRFNKKFKDDSIFSFTEKIKGEKIYGY